MGKIIKSVKLNILPLTSKKEQMLSELEKKWCDGINHLFETLDTWDVFNLPFTRYNLQNLEYNHIRKRFNMHSQHAVDMMKDAFTVWQNNGRNGINDAPVSFNIPRSGSFKETKHGNPVVSVSTLNGRTGLPVAQDGAWNRFQSFLKNGWNTTMFRIKRNGNNWQVLVSIFKNFSIKGDYDTVIGIDTGSRTLATISIINRERKTLKQIYMGRDIWNKQRDFSIRRSKLQRIRDTAKGDNRFKAIRKLNRLKGYESCFVKTRIYEIANRIIDLAREYNGFIAIEDLKGLKESKMHRKSNRRVKRMPFYKFRVALEQIAGQNNTLVVAINPRHTSQRCSRCGIIRKTNNVVFSCPSCGFECNRDRNASVNIAHVAGNEFFKNKRLISVQKPQISMGDAPVNGHGWKNEKVLSPCLQHAQSSDFKPMALAIGS